MADNTTVQTAPAPRQPHEEQIRLQRLVATCIPQMGIEVNTVAGESEIPAHWSDVRFRVPLHQDGNLCTATCQCAPRPAQTTIRLGETTSIGEWTWFGGQHCLIGWRRIGSSGIEKDLREKLMKAYGERDEARADRDRAIEDFESGHDLCDADLERAKQDGRRWGRVCGALVWTAAAGWGAAIALGVALALVLAGAIG